MTTQSNLPNQPNQSAQPDPLTSQTNQNDQTNQTPNNTQRPVKIHVHTTITNGAEQQTFELTSFGQYYQKHTSAFLQYDEVLEDGSTAKTTMKLNPDDLILSRTGGVQMRMKLHPQSRQRGSYKTPYGELELITKTTNLAHHWDPNAQSGTIHATYDLHIQGDHAGTYQLQINFEEEQQ